MGNRPCNSGMRSEGFATWNAPAAMNRTWSVRTGPYFVVTEQPSTMGRMSRCTPSRDTSGPWLASRPAILSISSRNTTPACSARSTASAFTRSMSSRFSDSSAIRTGRASATVTVRLRVRLGIIPPSMSRMLMSISSTPPGVITSMNGGGRCSTSMSMVFASKSPLRSFVRNRSRVRANLSGPESSLSPSPAPSSSGDVC